MSWLYSQALVGAYLGDISLDGEQSVPSSGNLTQQAYCAPDKMTEFSRLSRFGMMFKPLTDDRGEALLMSYLAAFHAKTSPQPEKEPELTESGQGCGEKWHGSFTRYDPDSSLWRTHQCSLLGDLEPFSETWPRWGLMRNGECWEQQMSALRTSETESGFVPNGETFFHTPNCTGLDGGSNSRKAMKKRQEMWPTPRASTGGPEMSANKHRPSGHRGTNNLAGAVKMWTTPVADDTSYRKDKYAQGGTALSTQAGGKLNPMWVEWLMGWPLGWTDLKPLEMDKFQKWLEEHGRL
jgi:hypothetical protein